MGQIPLEDQAHTSANVRSRRVAAVQSQRRTGNPSAPGSVTHPKKAHLLNRFSAIMARMANNRDLFFEDWCDPVDLRILQDAEKILAQRAWQDACLEQAQRQAEEESFARALNASGFCGLGNVRTFMTISAHVAITRRAPLTTLLAARRRILVGLLQDKLSNRLCRLAARRAIALAATPSGRSIPSDCLTPRLVAQRPFVARATRAVLMR
ncbi:MAG: hypothetical protein J0I24_15740 [Thiomonas arsenitoxydans]|uniref:Uncharacterized protein n=2 Tax=Burkholderiales genera incertae sedis TaxID=224471 RepID=A0A8I1MXS8_THIA3|nr:hypothetical protein [Thiomonas arsenitoxydans]ODU91520.1 MAG: hypothetical protein ABT24_14625 [Thiomonas sp. SCN 64-16]